MTPTQRSHKLLELAGDALTVTFITGAVQSLSKDLTVYYFNNTMDYRAKSGHSSSDHVNRILAQHWVQLIYTSPRMLRISPTRTRSRLIEVSFLYYVCFAQQLGIRIFSSSKPMSFHLGKLFDPTVIQNSEYVKRHRAHFPTT